MYIEDWTEATLEREAREEKLKAAQAKKKRRRRTYGKVILGLLVFSVLLVGALYGGTELYRFVEGQRQVQDVLDLREEEDVHRGEKPGEDATVPAMGVEMMYSREEMQGLIADAVAAAKNEEAERVLEGIKVSLSAGTTTVETLRPFYPDDIVVVSGGRFHFVPIDRNLKQNPLQVENLNILENGEYQYLTDGQVTSHKGIDVSSHQGKIDWEAVAADGVEFAIIRAAFRGYGTGKLVEDTEFERNIEGAIDAGIKVGVYVFSQAITADEIMEEAQLVLKKIEPYEITCPVVFDVEKVSGAGRMNALSVQDRTDLTLLFLRTIENAGYKPMVYHNTEMGALMIDLSKLEEYDKWYASYSDQMFYPYEYKIWQYSDKGRVNGIDSDVDMNICFSPIWEE